MKEKQIEDRKRVEDWEQQMKDAVDEKSVREQYEGGLIMHSDKLGRDLSLSEMKEFIDRQMSSQRTVRITNEGYGMQNQPQPPISEEFRKECEAADKAWAEANTAAAVVKRRTLLIYAALVALSLFLAGWMVGSS